MQQPITFEIELIRQVEINIDYILMLVMKYHESNCKDKSILGTIDRAIDSSIQLRSKKDLIHGFINTVNAATDVDRDWQSYYCLMPVVKAKLFCPEIAGLFCRIAGLFCHDSRANLSLKPVCFGIAIS